MGHFPDAGIKCIQGSIATGATDNIEIKISAAELMASTVIQKDLHRHPTNIHTLEYDLWIIDIILIHFG